MSGAIERLILEADARYRGILFPETEIQEEPGQATEAVEADPLPAEEQSAALIAVEVARLRKASPARQEKLKKLL